MIYTTAEQNRRDEDKKMKDKETTRGLYMKGVRQEMFRFCPLVSAVPSGYIVQHLSIVACEASRVREAEILIMDQLQ